MDPDIKNSFQFCMPFSSTWVNILQLDVKGGFLKGFSGARRYYLPPSEQDTQLFSSYPVQPFETPWTATRQACLSFTVSCDLLKLVSIDSIDMAWAWRGHETWCAAVHGVAKSQTWLSCVHWVCDSSQPSYPLLSPSPPAFNLSQHQGLFQWVGSSHQVVKVLELQLQSTSVLPMNIQNWSPLGWTGLISLKSKGLSRVFSSTTVQKFNSLLLSLLYGPAFTSIQDY